MCCALDDPLQAEVVTIDEEELEGEERNFAAIDLFLTNSTKLRDVAQFRMNNLLDVPVPRGFTHIRFETPAAQRNFVYRTL